MGTDSTGTGGKHTIKGRIFFPSGRRIDSSIKITLESITTGNLSVFADSYGTFSFTNLVGGTYTIVIEASEYYEGIRESVTIDDGGGRYVRTVANIISVNLQLVPKRANTSKPGVVNAALASIPKNALELYDKGLESGQAGDARKAIEYFNGALKIYPEFALALNELGVQYLTLKQTDKAIEILRDAVKYAPNETTPHLNLGIALYTKNEITECEAELQEAIKKNQKSWAAHMYLGLTRLKQRNYDEAEKELLQTLTLGGDNLSLPHYYLGGIYWRQSNYKRAADELEKYLKLSPKAPDAEQTKKTIKELRSKQH
ncbi:MAG TPA: tetratricopeptide repeat protein [Pyrinomonadaceae bacterium]